MNNRFAILSESPAQPRHNIFKQFNNTFNKTLEPKQPTHNLQNFPELVYSIDKTNNETNDYKHLFNKTIEDKPQDMDLVNLKRGWALLKRDPNTREVVMKSEYIMKTPPKNESVFKSESFNELFKSIVEQNNKRTNEIIELNGYDTWYNMYQFPSTYTLDTAETDTSDDESYADDDDNSM
jgi:hypothetical protein